MATQTEQLILRGLHLLLRTTFSPNNKEAQAKHFMGIQADVGPWFKDYVTVMDEPDTVMIPSERDPGGSGGLQQ